MKKWQIKIKGCDKIPAHAHGASYSWSQKKKVFISILQDWLHPQSVVRRSPVVSDLSGGLWGQNYFLSNAKMLFGFFDIVVTMVHNTMSKTAGTIAQVAPDGTVVSKYFSAMR